MRARMANRTANTGAIASAPPRSQQQRHAEEEQHDAAVHGMPHEGIGPARYDAMMTCGLHLHDRRGKGILAKHPHDEGGREQVHRKPQHLQQQWNTGCLRAPVESDGDQPDQQGRDECQHELLVRGRLVGLKGRPHILRRGPVRYSAVLPCKAFLNNNLIVSGSVPFNSGNFEAFAILQVSLDM